MVRFMFNGTTIEAIRKTRLRELRLVGQGGLKTMFFPQLASASVSMPTGSQPNCLPTARKLKEPRKRRSSR